MTAPGALAAFSNFFSNPRTESAGPPSIAERSPKSSSPSQRSNRALGPAPDAAVTEAFEQIVYRKQVERAAVSFQRAQSNTTDGAESQAAEQLSFSFEAEFEVLELARFEQRIARAAEGAGNDAQRTRLLEAARGLAARFSVSIEISASALNGFASGAEESAEAGDSSLDQFIDFAKDALDKLDSIFNEIFEAFDGFLNGTGDIETKFEEVFNQLKSIFEGSGDEVAAASQESVSIQLEFEFESIEITRVEGEVQASDPVVLDLDGDGFEFTDVGNGASFDLLGSGRAQRAAFVTGGDAFLALDRNGNGAIDDGTELFGDQRGAANGFEELRKLDSNRDGVIDAKDDRFDDLRLFRDDGDGRTERGELLRLRDAGVEAIDLNYANRDEAASGGNRLAQIASFRHADGRIGRAADALLNLIV